MRNPQCAASQLVEHPAVGGKLTAKRINLNPHGKLAGFDGGTGVVCGILGAVIVDDGFFL